MGDYELYHMVELVLLGYIAALLTFMAARI
jgi:hypothetical protein